MMRKIIVVIFLLSIGFGANAHIEQPIKWSYAAKRISPTEALLYLKADIAVGWHIYSVNQKDGGPKKISFGFLSSKDFSLIGKVQEPKPIKKNEEVFDMDVFYFEKSVVFTQKIKLNKGETLVEGKVSFMACTHERCLPPDDVGFSIPVK